MPGMARCIQCGANIPEGDSLVRKDKDGNDVVVCKGCAEDFTNV